MDEGNGYGPHLVRIRIGSVVGPYFSAELKVNISQVIQAGAIVPHARKYLRHVSEVSLHGELPDVHTVIRQCCNYDPVNNNL